VARLKARTALWRTFVLLALVVLAVHLWLLRPQPTFVRAAAKAPQPWIIRAVDSVPATPAALATPVEQAAPARQMPGVRVARETRAVRPVRAEIVPVAAAAPATPSATAVRTAFAAPPSMKLHYEVTAQAKGISLRGEGELQWRNDGNRYEARLEVSSPFLPKRIQQSAGAITADGLAPLRFSDKARSEEAAHFDREGGKVTFSSNRPDAALEAGAQDRLSVTLQLGAMIAGEPKKYPAGTSISVQTASTREAEPWVFTVEGAESLALPGGTVNTLKLTRNPRKEFDQKVELWIAPGMDYVPVRLRLTQPNGDWVDQQWSSTDRS
jgi:hypothetical protein